MSGRNWTGFHAGHGFHRPSCSVPFPDLQRIEDHSTFFRRIGLGHQIERSVKGLKKS